MDYRVTQRDEIQYRICKQQKHVLKTVLLVAQSDLRAKVVKCSRCKQTLILFLNEDCYPKNELGTEIGNPGPDTA